MLMDNKMKLSISSPTVYLQNDGNLGQGYDRRGVSLRGALPFTRLSRPIRGHAC